MFYEPASDFLSVLPFNLFFTDSVDSGVGGRFKADKPVPAFLRTFETCASADVKCHQTFKSLLGF
jgi:hypothetical protein